MTIKNLYPATFPSLLLDFANSKRLDSRITFTRSSTGTHYGSDGLVKTAAVNEARFDHNPTTGDSLGLLVEEARANRHTYSEQFDNAAWTKYGATITANATTAPDGTTTADKFASTSGAALIAVQQADTTLTNGASYTRTVFAKASEISSLTLQVGNTSTGTVFVQVNLLTGTATSGGVVTTLANGWFRISYSYTQSGTTGDFYLTLPANTVAGSGVFIWGAQLETGSFPTSYIPTTASTVTRSADVASITGTNFSSWNNSLGGTYSSLFRANGATPFSLNGAGGSSDRLIFLGVSSQVRAQMVTGGNTVYDQQPATTYSTTATNKYAFAFISGSQSSALNGTTGGAGVATSIFTPTSMQIGRETAFNYYLNGTLSFLAYWPTRLSNATLQAITR